jgi:hypothetical protein
MTDAISCAPASTWKRLASILGTAIPVKTLANITTTKSSTKLNPARGSGPGVRPSERVAPRPANRGSSACVIPLFIMAE